MLLLPDGFVSFSVPPKCIRIPRKCQCDSRYFSALRAAAAPSAVAAAEPAPGLRGLVDLFDGFDQLLAGFASDAEGPCRLVEKDLALLLGDGAQFLSDLAHLLLGGHALLVGDGTVVRREGHVAQLLLAGDEVLILFVDKLLFGGEAVDIDRSENVELVLRALELMGAHVGETVRHARVALGVVLPDFLHVGAHLRRRGRSAAFSLGGGLGRRRWRLDGLLLFLGGDARLRELAFQVLDALAQAVERHVVGGGAGGLFRGLLDLALRCLWRGGGGADEIPEQRTAEERRNSRNKDCAFIHEREYSKTFQGCAERRRRNCRPLFGMV